MIDSKKSLKIGQVAALANLSVESIRYYEQRGLLQAPRRSQSGYREYSHRVLERLAFIARAKVLGFSLTEIGELLQLQISPDADRGQVKQVVVEKLELVEQKLQQLQQLKGALQKLACSCDGHGSVDDCPIITFLQQGDAAALCGEQSAS